MYQNAVKRAGTILRKIAWRNYLYKLPIRLSGLRKILRCLQKIEKNTWDETQEECVLPGCKENSRDLYGRKQLFLCSMEGKIIKINKCIALVKKLIQWEPNDWLRFKEHLKNYTRLNFNKHQLNNKLRMKRNPMR